MNYTIEQKIEDCKTLKKILSELHSENAFLFICNVTCMYLENFNTGFRDFIISEMCKIGTKYRNIECEAKGDISESLVNHESVWDCDDLDNRLKFIDMVIEDLECKKDAYINRSWDIYL